MPRLTPASTAKRRLHIVEAAMRCFRVKGFTATSVDDICAEGAISKGAFYSHFRSKEDLVHAIADVLAGNPDPLDSSSLTALTASILDRRGTPSARGSSRTFAFEMIAASLSDSVLHQRLVSHLDTTLGDLEQAIAVLVASGLARPDCDPAATAAILQSYLLGSFTNAAIRSLERTDEVGNAVERLIEALIAPR